MSVNSGLSPMQSALQAAMPPAMHRAAPTLMVMAGGTGGHIYPGLAVATALRQRGWQLVWMGSRSGMEAQIVPRHDIAMAWVQFSGLRGRGLLATATLPLRLLRALWQSLQALRRYRPDVVLGMGGYMAVPGGLMAALSGRKLLIHEQNSVPGLANRLLARVAHRVMTAFPQELPGALPGALTGALPGALWTGNPVRAEISAIAPPAQRFADRRGPLRLLVVGGSLGAAALNSVVPQALALLPVDSRPLVVHQAGAKNIETLQAAYAVAAVPAELRPYIEDMAAEYAAADVVICRAGAMTVAELSAAGVASVLVPFPHAVDDHQTANARYLSSRQAGMLLPQAELTPQRLADLLSSFTRPSLLAMADAARALGRPDATQAVADICQACVDGLHTPHAKVST
jgi:UDP-N-acetylglucosamine--N-acetylmuramyl-(pentapeptide) pyrophosphoryl-undecaprenol N-acetylglucosamine transferase